MLYILPDEIIVNILQYLEIDDLIRFLSSSKTISVHYKIYFKNKIEKEYHNFIYPQESVNNFMKRLELETTIMSQPMPRLLEFTPFLLSQKLTKIMNLSNFYTIDGCAIYNLTLLRTWWNVYFCTNNLITNEYDRNIKMDCLTRTILDENVGDTITKEHFFMILSKEIYNKTVTINDEIKYAFLTEHDELQNYLYKSIKKERYSFTLRLSGLRTSSS